MNEPLASVFCDVPDEASQSPPSLTPLTVWSPSKFLNYAEPAGSHLVLPAYVTKGELTTLIGQGGIGKSRLALWLAICQITGRQWCGLESGGEPQKWLMLGDENSISRIKCDLEHLLQDFSEEDKAKVEQLLRVQAVLPMEDVDVNLGDAIVQARLILTIQQTVPGAIVLDPLANFAPGDISKPGEMKEAIRLLMRTVRKVAPNAALVLLHHSRTGRQNIAQGTGFDAANFGSGGKGLFAAARCQMNLMPASEEDDTRLVLSCAKANNCARFLTRGLILDRETYSYRLDPEFDLEEWKADVEGRSRSGQSVCTVADVVSAVRDDYVETKALVDHLGKAYDASKRTVHRLIAKAVKAGGIKQAARGRYSLGHKADKLSPPRLL